MPRFTEAFIALVLLAAAQVLDDWLPLRLSPTELAPILLATILLPAALCALILRPRRGENPQRADRRGRGERVSHLGPLAGFVLLLAFGWGGTPERWIPPVLPGVAAAAVLFPLIAGWALAAWPRLRADYIREGIPEPVGRGVGRELRPTALVFAAYGCLRAVSDLGWVFPRLRETLVNDPVLSVVGVLALVGSVVLISPFAVRWLHPARPLPAGPLRERLDRLAAATGVSLHEVWIWETGPQPSINACVSGIVPAHRSVFLTDGLLAALDDAEIEGVFAHELAHGTLHHLWIYTALVFGVAGLVVGSAEAARQLGVEPGAGGGIAFFLALGLLFFRSFGTLSRHFESQADIFSAARTGSPFGIVSALGKIGSLTGTLHRRSWRHPPIPERIATILRCATDPRRLAEFTRRTRRFLTVCAIVFIAGVAGWTSEVAGRLAAPRWERDLSLAAYLIAADSERLDRPGSDPARSRADLERSVGLIFGALPELGSEPRLRAAAYQGLAQAYDRLGDPLSAAAARFLAGAVEEPKGQGERMRP